MQSKARERITYFILLAIQTLAVGFLLWIVFPIFYSVITHFGEQQDIRPSRQLGAFAGTLLLQTCYWARVRWVTVQPPCHNTFIAHLVFFAARLSFVFGGAFFSAIFFRHLPELGALPPFGEALIRAVSIVIILFGLFCYSLELDRLGKAIEPPAT
ncbi:hypothetical protein AB4Z52_21970 [Rhizobium sp. 2YAF20]|uniref:hypothetical protein n=1 Tax=Rhizobium sp. 2YAF20 TaxID=3233027 RepID=UPI003F94AA82